MKDRFYKVLEETKNGFSAVDACKTHGVNTSSYYAWKTNQKKRGLLKTTRRKKPSVTTFELPQAEGRLFAFYGTPSEVIAAIRNLQ